MILSEDINDSTYQIRAYHANHITINDQTYSDSLIISPHYLRLEWPPKHAHDISEQDLLTLTENQPEIILLGTGKRSIILPARTLAPLMSKQYHIECMSTEAACKTYAVLSAEGRKVVAGLIIEKSG